MQICKKALGLWISAVMLLSCVSIISAQEDTELYNVSFNKYTWASSVSGDDYDNYAPSLAVDGNYSSGWVNGLSSDIVDNGKNIQYWAVDLYKSYPISEIRFTGRLGISWEHQNFRIEIANNRDFQDAEIVHTVGTEGYADGEEQIVSLDGKEARYIRFIKTDDGGFGLMEVAVMSANKGLVNVARGKDAEAPFTYDDGASRLDEGRIVDGMYAGDWADGYVGGNVSYVQVDLGEDYQKYELEEIRYLPGNIGHVQNPNTNFRIVVSSDPTFQEALTYEVYRNEGTAQPVTGELSINLSDALHTAMGHDNAAKTFRYIRVTKLAAGETMTISELSVLGRNLAGKGENVAKGKTVEASSNHPFYPVTGAVDGWYLPEGVDGARWLMADTDKNRPWIMVDLGQEYRLNSLVFQMMGVDSVSYVDFQIEISLDKEFAQSHVIYSQGSDPLNGRGSVTFAGDEGVCRYIRIQSLTDIGGTDYRLFGVAEIAAYSTDLPYEPSDRMEFLTSEADATSVDVVPESGEFAVRFRGINSGADVRSITLIQAGYTNNALSSVKLYPMTVPAGVTALPMVQTVSTADQEGTVFRFFAWEDETLRPLCAAGELVRAS